MTPDGFIWACSWLVQTNISHSTRPSEIRQAWARWRFHYLHGVLWPQLRAGGQYSMMWITQNSSCKALECTVLWQQDFLPNSILGSEHTPINTCKKVCWEIRGSLVLGTIHRPPSEWKVHTRLYWRQKSGLSVLWAGRWKPSELMWFMASFSRLRKSEVKPREGGGRADDNDKRQGPRGISPKAGRASLAKE